MTRGFLIAAMIGLIASGCNRGPSSDQQAAGAAVDAAVKLRSLVNGLRYDQGPADQAYAEFQAAKSRAEREAGTHPATAEIREIDKSFDRTRGARIIYDISRPVGDEKDLAKKEAAFDTEFAAFNRHIEAAKAALK